jgi:WD40 repeat protein
VAGLNQELVSYFSTSPLSVGKSQKVDIGDEIFSYGQEISSFSGTENKKNLNSSNSPKSLIASMTADEDTGKFNTACSTTGVCMGGKADFDHLICTLATEHDIFDCRVDSVQWSPDNRRIASGAANGTIFIWNAAMGILTTMIQAPSQVFSVCWSSDGAYVSATFSGGETLSVWNADTGDLWKQHDCRSAQGKMAWHPSDYKVVIGFVSVSVIDVHSGHKIEMHGGHTKVVKDICWSPNGKRVLSAGYDGAFVWDLGEQQGHQIFHENTFAVAWCPDGSKTVLAHGQGVSILSSDDWLELRVYAGNGSRVMSLAWHPFRYDLMICAGENMIFVWDTNTCEILDYFRNSSRPVNCVRWSASGNEAVSASEDGCVSIWSIPPAEVGKQPELYCHFADVTSVAWNPTYEDGYTLASVSIDGQFIVWDVDKAEPLTCLEEEEGEEEGEATDTDTRTVVKWELVTWSTDGALLASSAADNIIRIWDFSECRLLATLRGHDEKLMDMSWSPCASSLVSVSLDGSARVWSARDGALQVNLFGDSEIDLGLSVAWSPSGGQLVVGSRFEHKSYVHVFDTHKCCTHARCMYSSFAQTRRLLCMGGDFVSPDALAWTADSSRLAVTATTAVQVWDSRSWDVLFTIESAQVDRALTCLRWSGDNVHLAAGSINGIIYIWTVSSNSAVLLKCLDGHLANDVTGVDWSADGQRLASAAKDTHVIVWDVFPDL